VLLRAFHVEGGMSDGNVLHCCIDGDAPDNTAWSRNKRKRGKVSSKYMTNCISSSKRKADLIVSMMRL
jgi:hypothetical protein